MALSVGTMLLAGCSVPTHVEPSVAPPVVTPSGPAGVTPPAPQTNCTARATDADSAQKAFNVAGPGSVICLSGDLTAVRLKLFRSGSAEAPVRVLGDGKVRTRGLDVRADHVVVDGITADKPQAPGISLMGTGIVLQNSRVDDPQDEDRDALRFWGQGIKILHNTMSNTRNVDRAHADCMQTFATDSRHPASRDILIDGNRCENIDNNCLIVEGPRSSAGDGSGVGETRNITWTDNYCDNKAAQAVLLDDVRGATLTDNQVVKPIDHAFAIQNRSTGVTVTGNKLHPGVRFEVGMDTSSRPGYRGPAPGGQP